MKLSGLGQLLCVFVGYVTVLCDGESDKVVTLRCVVCAVVVSFLAFK